MNAHDADAMTIAGSPDSERQPTSVAAMPAEPLSGKYLERVIEALLLASDEPLSVQRMDEILDGESPGLAALHTVLNTLSQACAGRGVELKEVSSGFRYQVRADMASWISRLWAEKPARLSRAFMETLALVAYRQPITRAEIEDIRGVSVGSGVLRTLLERGWVKVIGHREVPGRPSLYATTREFLDYFNLKSIQDLPALPAVPSGEMAQLPLSETMLPGATAASSDGVEEGEFSGETPTENPDTESGNLQAVQIDAA